MTYIQYNTPKPNAVNNFSLRNFVGGLNNRSDQVNDNEATDILNLSFADDTIMETRKGQTYFDEMAFTDEVLFIDEYMPYRDENVLIRATKNKVYINNAVLTTAKSKIQGVNHKGMYVFVDGEKIYSYGLYAQTTSTYYKVTGTPVNDYVLLEVVSPGTYTPLGTEHVQGVLHVNYTNYTICYEPCQLEMEDNFKGANVVPANLKYIVSHGGRIFASGANEDNDNVFISDLRSPFYFPVSLPIQLPPNSDKVVGLHVYNDAVIVGRSRDIHMIFGETNRTDIGGNPFRLRKLNSHTGVASGDTMRLAHNYIIFLGSDGVVYAINSSREDTNNLATQILSQTLDLFKSPIGVTEADLLKAHGYFFDGEYLLQVGNKTLVYSYRHISWTMYTGINATSFYGLDSQLIWCNTSKRTVKFNDELRLDFGQPYRAHWYSKYFDMGYSHLPKFYRDFILTAHTFGSFASDINVLFEVDYIDIRNRVVITNKISRWGESRWGDRFITRNINESLPFRIGNRGRAIRFKFFSGYIVDGSVDDYADLEYYPAKRDWLCVYVTSEDNYYLFMDRKWILIEKEELNQRMKIYQVDGDYEVRRQR